MARPLLHPFVVALMLLLPSAASLAAQTGIQVEELPEERPPQPPAEAAPAPPTETATAPAVSPQVSGGEQEAILAYSEGDLSRALELYRELGRTQESPAERSRLLLTAAWLAWQLQDPAEARRLLEEGLFADPQVPFSEELYSPEFRDLYQDALRLAVHQRQVRASEAINEAVSLMRAERYAPARELLGEALRLSPDDPDGLYNLALLELRQGHEDAALAGFQRVLALERGNPEGVTRELKGQALNNSAVIYFGRSDYEDAEAALAEAVKVEPGDARAWFNLALARQKLGRADEGYDALRRARALAPADLDVTRALGIAELDRRDFHAAAGLLAEAVAARPGDADLELLHGRALRGAGDAAGAADAFRRALALDPENAAGIGATASLLLTETLRSSADLPGWTAAAETAVRLSPQNASAWMLLGLARQQAHDLPGAVAALDRAHELAPQRADVMHNLGAVMLEQQAYDEAEADFRMALRLDPGNAATAAALDRLVAEKQRVAAEPRGRKPELGATLIETDVPARGGHGLRVDGVALASPAAAAGLRLGDLILRADGQPVESAKSFEKLLRKRPEGVLVDLDRAGQAVQTMIRVQ